MSYKYTDDDYCDIYENKICDNCGKCLEMEGIDVKAIKIEDIAKTVEENKVLEEEYLNSLKSNEDADLDDEELDHNALLKKAYEKFQNEHEDIDLGDDEYEDAFDHIDYSEELDLDESNIDELTEEVFPGVRKLKKTKKINE